MLLKRLYHDGLAQASCLVGCQKTREALVIDPHRDAAQYVAAASEDGSRITHVTETHIHADFLSGSRELAQRTGARLLLSAGGGEDWQYAFAAADRATLLRDGDSFMVGNLRLDVVHTPGHTPEHPAIPTICRSGRATVPARRAASRLAPSPCPRSDMRSSSTGRSKKPRKRRSPKPYWSVRGWVADDALVAWSKEGEATESVEQIDAVDLSDALRAQAVCVIDVRAASEWDAGHLPGALHIPLGRLATRLTEIPRDRPVVVQCQSGTRSAIAASVLLARGVHGVRNLRGGFAAWERAGLLVERGDDALTVAR